MLRVCMRPRRWHAPYRLGLQHTLALDPQPNGRCIGGDDTSRARGGAWGRVGGGGGAPGSDASSTHCLKEGGKRKRQGSALILNALWLRNTKLRWSEVSLGNHLSSGPQHFHASVQCETKGLLEKIKISSGHSNKCSGEGHVGVNYNYKWFLYDNTTVVQCILYYNIVVQHNTILQIYCNDIKKLKKITLPSSWSWHLHGVPLCGCEYNACGY